MRFTRFGFFGLVFYALMVGAYFLSPYSNLFFLLLAFLTILGLSGVNGAVRNLRGVRASLVELPPVPALRPIEVPIELRARPGTRFQIDAVLELAGGERVEGRADLLEGSARLLLRASGLPRGVHRIERARIASSHPLGFFRLYRTFEAPSELVVHPAPAGLAPGRTADTLLDELLGSGGAAAGDFQPAGLRDHRPEDGPRGIHWRASARRGALVAQEWEGVRGQGLEVVLDRRCDPEELERALEAVSAMVHLARTNKETLRLHTQGVSATFGEGQRPWAEVLRVLAEASTLPTDGPAPPSVSPSVVRLPRAPGARTGGVHV